MSALTDAAARGGPASRVRKAVFPAAGLGTRFLPATKAQPKEMLPLVDKPIIQYGVEEAVASGIANIILVTGRGKNAIEDHFDVFVRQLAVACILIEQGKHFLLQFAIGGARRADTVGSGSRSSVDDRRRYRDLSHVARAYPPLKG
jgi:UTP--glucose-1-phosphate uridylyltransferase